MSVVLIDKGVPIPVRSNGQERTDLPLVEMEIGDSFVLPAGYNKAGTMARVAAYGKTHGGQKFCSCTKGGVTRIWRVA